MHVDKLVEIAQLVEKICTDIVKSLEWYIPSFLSSISLLP